MSIITLVGIMYAGKTTVVKKLSAISSLVCFDIDQIITKKIMPITDIFTHYGEIRFRELEYQAISNIIINHDKCVIAVGGGAFANDKTRSLLLAKTHTIWLKVNFPTVLSRISKEAETRPLASKLNTKFFKERNKAYQQANYHIECDSLIPDEITTIVMKIITSLG